MSNARNHKNDRLKRDYLVWLRDAKQRSPATVDQVRHAIDRFETYIRFKGFETFNPEHAMGSKHFLLETDALRSGKPMSLSTIHHILQANKDFLAWLHNRAGFRRAISLHDIAYLNLSKGEERQACTSKPKENPSVEEFQRAIMAIPEASDTNRRDRSVMAMRLLTGMRDAALIGLKMRDVDMASRYIFQDPRHANTKFQKPIHTFLLPIGGEVDRIFGEWISFLRGEKEFGPDDPVFPKTQVGRARIRSLRRWDLAASIGRMPRPSGAYFAMPSNASGFLSASPIPCATRWFNSPTSSGSQRSR